MRVGSLKNSMVVTLAIGLNLLSLYILLCLTFSLVIQAPMMHVIYLLRTYQQFYDNSSNFLYISSLDNK